MKPWVDMADKQTKTLHSGKAISFLNPSAILDKLCFTFFSKVSQTRLSSCLYPGNHFPSIICSQCHQLPGRCLPDLDSAGTTQVQLAVFCLCPCNHLLHPRLEAPGKHWPSNEHPASLRIRLKVPLSYLSYLLPNTGGSCWWQVSCCQLDRLTQEPCSKNSNSEQLSLCHVYHHNCIPCKLQVITLPSACKLSQDSNMYLLKLVILCKSILQLKSQWCVHLANQQLY